MEYRIKEILKARGMSQKDLAESIGVTPPSLSQSLSGNPTIGMLEKIAGALGVPLAELFADWTDGEIVCPHCGGRISIEIKKGGK